MEKGLKKILTIVMMALILIVAIVLIAVFASRGSATNQTGETTTSKPEEEGPKFIVPKDGSGNPLLKIVQEAQTYCDTEYKGELATSSSMDDWKDPESVKTFLKSAIDGVSGDYFITGLFAYGEKILNESGDLGKISDFSSDHELTVDTRTTDVIVKPGYVLANKVVSPGAFICQYD